MTGRDRVQGPRPTAQAAAAILTLLLVCVAGGPAAAQVRPDAGTADARQVKPLAPPARCIWFASPSRSRAREMEPRASTGASRSAQPSATSTMPDSLARTAAG